MPLPTKASPNVGNYQVAKGIVSFQKEGTTGFRDMGNVESMVLTPKLTTLDHFTSRAGVKGKDLIIVLEKQSTCKIVMDEVTAANISLMVLGSYDENAVGGPEVNIFDLNAVNGWLKFVGTNDVGAKCTVDLYNVSFTPSGDFSLISDEWNKMEATADVLVSGGLAAVAATGLLSSVAIANADTVTIGANTYTFDSSLAATPNHVKIGANLAATLANFAKAINLTGIAGTDYGAGTVIHPTVSAVAGGTTLSATAKTAGAAGNAIASTKVSAGSVWGAATLVGGADADATNAGKFGLIKLTNVVS